jgi:hypothetical protein
VIGLDVLDQIIGGRLGTHDVPCPECGPFKSARGQRKRTLRVWRVDPGFATFHCARCGEQGFTRDGHSGPPDPVKLAKARAQTAERDRATKADRLSKALLVWRARQPIGGTIAERYLREVRGYGGQLPTTLGFLPARGTYPPAMIAAFGLAQETEPGILAIADRDITGVHLTRLKPDGSGKAVFEDPDENAKIMIGYSAGSPIVLAPPNDLLGLAVTEGIEDGLSVHEDTGLGVWAAGAASRMPSLAEALPVWVDCVTVITDDDRDGRRFASGLVDELYARGMDARSIIAGAMSGVIA